MPAAPKSSLPCPSCICREELWGARKHAYFWLVSSGVLRGDIASVRLGPVWGVKGLTAMKTVCAPWGSADGSSGLGRRPAPRPLSPALPSAAALGGRGAVQGPPVPRLRSLARCVLCSPGTAAWAGRLTTAGASRAGFEFPPSGSCREDLKDRDVPRAVLASRSEASARCLSVQAHGGRVPQGCWLHKARTTDAPETPCPGRVGGGRDAPLPEPRDL